MEHLSYPSECKSEIFLLPKIKNEDGYEELFGVCDDIDPSE